MMTPDRLRALKAAATPGPWAPMLEEDREASVFSTHRDLGWVTPRPQTESDEGVTDADAALIALAPDVAEIAADMAEKLEDIATREWRDEGGRIAAAIARDALAHFAALPDEGAA